MSFEKLHVPSLLQLILSGLGLLVLIPLAFGLAVFGLILDTMPSLQGQSDAQGMLLLAWIAGFVSLLITPSAFFAVQRLLGKQGAVPGWRNGLRTATLLMLVWPLLLWIGSLIRQPALTWLILPPLQILVVALPIWWFVELGRRGLAARSNRQRSWGVLSAGLLINPPLILTLELVFLAVIIAAMLLFLRSRPDLAAQLHPLIERFQEIRSHPDEMLAFLRLVFNQPGVLIGLFGVISGLMPIIEELFKPLPLWFMANWKLEPEEGFESGLICGAAFALIESLLSVSSLAGDWVFLAAGRIGTGLLHVTTTGLVGWGLASALSQKSYSRLWIALLISTTFHSIWNIFGILLGIDLVAGFPASSLAGRLTAITPFALFALTGILFLLLNGANRILRRESTTRLGV